MGRQGIRALGAALPRAALLWAALLWAALLAEPAWPEEAVEPSGANFGGMGLVESRNARMRADGTIEAGASQRHQRRFSFINWQALPWLEATFRLTDRLNATTGHGKTTDRAFDLRARLWEENDWRPALAVGVQDAIGTGIYAAEYIVGSKRFWDFDLTLGMGWGRLATGSDLPNPLGYGLSSFNTRPRQVGQGGVPAFNTLFRGQRVDLFGGVEWNVPEIPTPFGGITGLRVKLEYSADALRDERGGYPARSTALRGRAETRFNAGLQWSNEFFDIGASFVHGTDAVLRLSLRLDPLNPPEFRRAPPPLMVPRPEPVEEFTNESVAMAVFPALREAGFTPLGLDIRDDEAVVTVSGGRFRTLAQMAARVARAAQPHVPATIERIRVVHERAGATIGRVVILREAMEAAAWGSGSAEEVFGSAQLLAAMPEAGGFRAPPPHLAWGIEPRLKLQLGDPQQSLRYQLGAAAGGRLELGWGIAMAGAVQQTLVQNMDQGLPSNSALPHVRSDFARYARAGTTSIPALYVERMWNPAPDWFARLSAGLLEPMFAGGGAELLWRPHDSALALGVDVNVLAQRHYRQRFAMLGYNTVTGHASAYWDTPWWNIYTVLRAGRYLAGDWGTTLEVGRRFDSGVEIGGFATFTNVAFSRFGEGSFDKGVFIRIPFDLFGPSTQARANLNFRTVQRDGGQRLSVDNPLWDVSRDGRADALRAGFGGFGR